MAIAESRTERTRRTQAAAPPDLRLMGAPRLGWRGRVHADWAYAKLPALVAVLAASGTPVRRDWLAALLWPDRDASSLRRALYDLRAHLGRGAPPWITSTRAGIALSEDVTCDLHGLLAADRGRSLPGGMDVVAATRALAHWDGDFAAGLTVPGADDFELWLMQARSHWQQRALAVAQALVEHHLAHGDPPAAQDVARRAVLSAPEAESAHGLWWRSLVGGGATAAAVDDWRRFQDLLALQGLGPSAALQALARDLGLVATPAAAPAASPAAALSAALTALLREGRGGADLDALLGQAQARLVDAPRDKASPEQVLLLRRTLMGRLMHAPWADPMNRLAAVAEAQLCRALPPADRLDLMQTLATWHGWMGRGIRGEVLLRGSEAVLHDGGLAVAAQVRVAMTLALCHSCSTGDPERSMRAARQGLQLARRGQVPGCRAAFLMLIANAALNRDGPGDAARARQALDRAGDDGPLLHFDLVNHLQLSAQWEMAHGDASRALALAEQGIGMARAVPFPLQELSCRLIRASVLMQADWGPALDDELDATVALARRIGSDGYLMNGLFVAAALARRQGRHARAIECAREAGAIARARGVTRIRKVPPALVLEAQGA